MTKHPINLDDHRGMQAQRSTEIRRLVAEIEADGTALRARQEALESQLIAAPRVHGWKPLGKPATS